MKGRMSKRMAGLLALMVIASILMSCTPAATPTAAPAAPAASSGQQPAAQSAKPTGDPIKVALIGPQSGTNAVLGEWTKKAVTLAIEEKNAAGGIKGRPIQLVVYDDEADPTKSVNLAQKVATEDKVLAAFATQNSSTTLADVPIFAQYKIPHITDGINPDITKKGSAYIFRNCPVTSYYNDSLIDAMVKKGFKKPVMIADNAAYGKGEGDAMEAALKRNNVQSLGRETHGIDDKDFTGQLTKLLQKSPDILLIGSSEIAAGLIAKQARQLGFKGQIAGGAAVGTPKFIETAGNDVAEGVYFANPYPNNDINDTTKAFAKKYAARWNGDVAESHVAKAYDGAQMLFMAMEKANPLTGENIAAEMHKICGYKGLQGEFCFDATGEGLKSVTLGVIKGGKMLTWDGK
ncbi:MAG TPA: ABC transporter substrate-binding protein [Anaerolineae bacterium]